MSTRITVRSLVCSLAFLALAATLVAAQESPFPQADALARQSLRPYWHVFAAYTIVIVMVGGWAVSIARRLRALEDRLVD